MSVYTQEVLGLLKRNKKKRELDKIRDHFEFGKLYQNSSLNTGAAYNPRMEPFVIKWGDFKCATEEGMVRQDPTGTQERYITMWTDPVFQGDCQTATITKTIISQNAIGDTINIAGDTLIEGDLQVNQNANITLQLTAGSANILDLTDNRIVIVGTDGELEDDANFTMDGTTFTANVNVLHGAVITPIPAVPATTTVLNSNIVLGGPIYDSAGNIGQLSQVLVGLADGRAVWSNDDIVEALTYGSLWQGNANNLKQELAIGTTDQILISDGTTFAWQNNPAAIVGEVCAVNSIPLWTPDSNTLGCSKLFQDGNNATPATKVTSSVTFNVVNTTSSIINIGSVAFNGTNRLDFIGFNNFSSGLSGTSDGAKITPMFYTSIAIDAYVNYIEFPYNSGSTNNKLTIGGAASEVVHPGLASGSVQILPDLELEKVDDDNTLDKVLVRDATTGIIKQRDASSISPPIGSGTLYTLPLWTPDGTKLGDSILFQDGDASTPATQVTIGGNVEVNGTTKLDTLAQDDALTQVLVRDPNSDNLLKWRDSSTIFNGSGTLYRLPLWTPNGISLGDSLLVQDGDGATPATQVTNDGILINTGVVKLDSVANDDSLVQVLVRDTGNSNEIKYRAASSIKPQVGFDTLAMTPDGWASTDGNFNAFVNLDDSVTAFKNINNMTWLVDGDRVVVIAANNKTGTVLADSVLRFPDWSSGHGTTVNNFSSWVPSSSDLAYPTSTLLYGEKVKFKAEMYDIPSTTNSQLNWDACCKIYSANLCPTGSNGSTTMDEDTTFTGAFNGIDDGYGGYGLTYSIVTIASSGVVTITNASTGAFTYTPIANFFGTDSVTWKVNDGYCDSINYTFTFTVNATDDAPRWTSTDPVTANTYPSLTGGDAWTYSWTVEDDDTPCASLTFPTQNIPSWLTFTNNGDCTGTLSGTYPTAGGNYAVQLNVTDGTDTASQSFNIGGLAVTEDTYFVNWFDGSGSMDTTGSILSANSSTPLVRCQSTGTGSGTVALSVQAGTVGATANVGKYVDDAGGNAYKAYKLLEVGMTVSGTGISAGTTIASVSNTSIQLSAVHTTSGGAIITFARTTAQKTTDYNDGSTFRNLLQDFYATGGTEGSGNTNSATNGADEYDNHVFFGWDGYSFEGNGERQIQYLANLGNPITGAGTKFPNASTVVVMAWGDESDNWYTDVGTPFASPTSTEGARVAADVSEVKTFIQDSEFDASNNSIYRGIWFSVSNNDTNYRNIGQGLQNGISPASQFSSNIGGWNDADLLVDESSGTPTRIQYAGQTGDTDYPSGVAANNANAGYYRGVVLAKLQDSGFSTLT
jgi:hypothetical protein